MLYRLCDFKRAAEKSRRPLMALRSQASRSFRPQLWTLCGSPFCRSHTNGAAGLEFEASTRSAEARSRVSANSSASLRSLGGR
jgi:hypothetical protein